MNTNLLAWLQSTGLDEQRSRLYITALSLGSTTAKTLAEKMNMGRTAVYDNLRFLEERGYVQVVQEGKRKLYVPLHPKELYKQFDNQRTQLKDLLPDFMSVYATESAEPFVQLFTGQYAAREVFEDILNSTKDEYVYFSSSQLLYHRVDKTYMKKWVERRVKKGVTSRSLRVQNREINDPVFTQEKEYLRQIRYLPKYVDMKSSIYIYGNNVGIITTAQEQSACIIYSPNLAFSLKQLFEFLWSISK